ncbi:MAG: MFS transporter [Candidatus Nezhaarchaeales archaeon]
MFKGFRFSYGWIIVAAGFLVLFAECILYLYGVFLKPLISEFGWSRTVASSVHALTMVTYSVMIIPVGSLYDRYGPRALMGIGGVLTGLGLMLSGMTSSIWHLYVSFGLLVGVGMSPLYVSVMSTLMKWFVQKRGLATGIATSGIGVGQWVMAPLSTYLIGAYGWRTSFIVVGAATMAMLLTAASIVKRSPEELKLPSYEVGLKSTRYALTVNGKALSLKEAVKTKVFWALYLSFMLASLALFIVMVHMVPYATDIGIDPSSASFALGLIGIAGITGKVVMGATSDRISRPLTLISCYLGEALTIPILLFSNNPLTLYLFAALFGFFYGGWIAMYTPITSDFFGLTHLGSILGAMATTFGLGGAIGPTFAGYTFDLTGSYAAAFTACAIIFVATAMLCGLARGLKDGERRHTRA